ncbi:hypothetical protein TPA0598_17_00210 [Streptomyces lydicamycinicus]|uniref:Integral membrane protein n=1 Tax=Streptomyces lydicamycinicus TaxID=1546107 RepID=A0A0P4RIZ1_9ACTN|nr:hypothetical protein [Streptomyces lydicamycinicus]GAO13040.1 hypothetical protein TPA0598_17_00210 [Streptomyces lydicamycinicus]
MLLAGPDDEPCRLVSGAAATLCNGDKAPAAPDPTAPLDPLSSLADSVAKAAAWTVRQLTQTLEGGGTVDFTNKNFLAQYAVLFAASTVLTLVLWLIAVTKRAMRGVPFTIAFGEAIGFLWLTVVASAFTPLVLYVLVAAVDQVTMAFGGSSGAAGGLFNSLSQVLTQSGESIGGGPIMKIAVSLLTIALAGFLWLELVLRATALYVGALLGAVVYSGMVDRALWPKVRRWAGLMLAIILVKPVIVVSVGIAKVFTADKGPDSTPVIVAGIVVIIIAIFGSVQIFRFVPGYGDDLVSGLALRTAKIGGQAGVTGVKAANSAVNVVARGIQAHGARTPRQSNGPSGGGKKSGASAVSEGLQAHGSRSAKNNKPKK